ncbi:MAG: thioesterase domain-containing protein [Clostridia bacterium]|nr:thioesterase domain-containing protein [Clostridia bacterium]
MSKIKLFCLPYAGGSAMVYSKWKRFLHNSIELCPIELAGRGKRFNEPFYESFGSAVEDVYNLVKSQIDDSKYAIFGHSMGSWLAYELILKLKESNYPEPVHAFFSGRYPPHIKHREEKIHMLPDDEFMSKILKYGGTPKELAENKELLAIFIPILRADYRILETNDERPEICQLGYGISVLNGIEDAEVTQNDLDEWEKYAGESFNLYEFDGGHFFINDHTQKIVDIINRTLLGAM